MRHLCGFTILFGPRILKHSISICYSHYIRLYFLLGGCLLTQLEYKLTGDSDNICNIALELLKMEKTKENQLKITKQVLTIYLPMILVIYYYRFIKILIYFQ